MLKVSTLKGQIVLCILLSLPVPSLLACADDGHVMAVAYILNLLIPIFVFFALFGKMTNIKGSEFKDIRIIIATLLWVVFWIKSFYEPNLFLILLDLIRDISGIYVFRIGKVLFVIYNAIGIAMVVILSYAIGKWINDKVDKIGKWINGKIDKNNDEINENRE